MKGKKITVLIWYQQTLGSYVKANKNKAIRMGTMVNMGWLPNFQVKNNKVGTRHLQCTGFQSRLKPRRMIAKKKSPSADDSRNRLGARETEGGGLQTN